MEVWINYIPRFSNSLYFSNRLRILDNPLIRLKTEYYHILIDALLKDKVIGYMGQRILLEIVPEDKTMIDLKYLEAISPNSLIPIFRQLRRYFRAEGKPSLYNPLIPGLFHTSVIPVLFSVLSNRDELGLGIKNVILDNAEIFSFEELLLIRYASSLLGATLILVVNHPRSDIISLAEKIILSSSFSLKTLSKIIGIDIHELYSGLKIHCTENGVLAISREEEYKPVPPLTKMPKDLDYVNIVFGDKKDMVYDLISEIYESGSMIGWSSLNELLRTRNIPLSIYNKLVKYGFIEELKSSTGFQVFLTSKSRLMLEKFYKKQYYRHKT